MREPPPGHSRLRRPGTSVIVRTDLAPAIGDAMQQGSLYAWAAEHPERRLRYGRLPTYAAPLPRGGPRVVVRRNVHGGWLAKWRGDRFIRSRAPYELEMSLVLAELGVPSTEVVAYAVYRTGLLNVSADVATLELPPGVDFGSAFIDGAPPERRTARWHAVTSLLHQLAEQGVWHQDLNAKNIYLVEDGDAPPRAVLLDVDRARLTDPGRGVAALNSARLLRSLHKLAIARGARLTAAELASLDVAKDLS
jgi:hypothetical protein